MSKLIFNKAMSLSYKGDRDYVYASDLFKIIIDTIIDYDIDNIEDLDYSIHKLLVNNVNFSLHELDHDETMDQQADVRITFTSNGIQYIGVINENSNLIKARSVYNEKEVFDNSIINKEEASIVLNKQFFSYTNLDVLTSMNKRLLKEVRPDIEGKWVSVRLQMSKLTELLEERKEYKVKLLKVFSDKYTRSNLYNEGKKIGSLYFSII